MSQSNPNTNKAEPCPTCGIDLEHHYKHPCPTPPADTPNFRRFKAEQDAFHGDTGDLNPLHATPNSTGELEPTAESAELPKRVGSLFGEEVYMLHSAHQKLTGMGVFDQSKNLEDYVGNPDLLALIRQHDTDMRERLLEAVKGGSVMSENELRQTISQIYGGERGE